MTQPDFRVIVSDRGEGITYTCGCPCVPTAAPSGNGEPGHEHCCCGKVHFAGTGASAALDAYLAERKSTRKREPEYTRGSTTVMMTNGPAEVAWAFPRE